ncbi:Hsp20/alpha crystallin family protein [Methylocaldum gracile]|jgi:HSP20 family protein|uniref:Hsp20/alpha crystallin family protein n=1 Tax=Methylocaldum sp. 0917 TaxID=2485163 RepID=UPI00105EDDEA
MSTLNHMHHGLHHTLHSLAEGWSALKQRASHALTRFTLREPPHEGGKLTQGASRWGLLPAEVREENDWITIDIEIPGMEADDFEIQILEDQLIVRGEKRNVHEGSIGERYFLLERAYGFFERVIHLPAEIDQDNIKARYRRGVLSISLPKTSHNRSQRITVTTA